jgi:hypothetical protein
MSELTRKQAISILLEAIDEPTTYSGNLKIVYGQQWGIRHVVTAKKTSFIPKVYKSILSPALKILGILSYIQPSGGMIDFRLHNGLIVTLRPRHYDRNSNTRRINGLNRIIFKIDKSSFLQSMTILTWRRTKGCDTLTLQQQLTQFNTK